MFVIAVRWFLAIVMVSAMTATVSGAEIEAVTTARYDLKLGFTVGGKVVSVPIKPGDYVEAGQVLMTLDDEEGEALVELYELRAASDLEKRAAQARLEMALVEEKAITQAYEHQAASSIEVERAVLGVKLAALELNMAQQRGREIRPQLRQARSRHKQYTLTAPTAGFVDTIVVAEGETVEELKPVMRLVVTDPLWIDAAVPTDQTLSIKTGDPAWVRLNLPGYDQPIQGKVIHMAQVADAASDTRLVRIEMSNHHGLPAGSPAMVDFTPPENHASSQTDAISTTAEDH